MKVIIVALAFVAMAAAAAVAPAEVVPPKILRSEFEQTPQGGYNFNFETENGINRNENGEVKEALDEDNKPHPVVVVKGSYSYVDPEGKTITITYVADELGFKAEGDSIPKPVSRR